MKQRILIVEDDDGMRQALAESLSKRGFHVFPLRDGREAIERIERMEGGPFDLLITDVRMPGKNGIDLLRFVKEKNPLLPVIVITAYATIEDAVRAIKEGAFDYLEKPFSPERLYETVQRAIGFQNGRVVYASESMKQVLSKAEMVAQTDFTVLLRGESGVGKELIARFIHERSRRREKPFVPVNCAALPETLLESELFGYEKGAFTGAVSKKPGRFEAAQGGTILLDEVTEMDLKLQAKLLRALQEGEIEVIGSRYPKKVDVRVIATTNRDVERLVEEGKFREDLYYRLNVFPIHIPPLRERKEDIPVLVEHLLKKYSKGFDVRIEEEAMGLLFQREWRGNVRELENVIARACVLSGFTVIKRAHLQDLKVERPEGGSAMRDMEMKLILETLRAVGGNRTKAASILGITARTIRNKLKAYRKMGIEIP